jgi:5'-3' exonuclease
VSDGVLLIDLASVVHPLWHMSASEPDPDHCAKQSIAKIHALASGRPHVAVCADSPISKRKQEDPTYKSQRPAQEATLSHQIALVETRLKADGFPVWKVDGYEADDLIASAVNVAAERDIPVEIVSSDKDLLALVCDEIGVSVKTPLKGERFDEAAVSLKFNIRPEQMRDYLSLVGDASDGVKGVPSIGPKSAAELLATFGTLDALMAALPQGRDALKMTPARYSALKDGIPLMHAARAMITLRADAPIPFDEILQDRIAAIAASEDTMTDLLTPDSAETAVAERLAEPTTETKPSAVVTAPATVMPDGPAETALIVAEPGTSDWNKGLEPRSLGDARVVAKWLFASRLFTQFGAPEAVLAVLLAGRELGLGAMASLRAFHVVQGRPTMAADFIRALVLASGKAQYFDCVERMATTATWKTKRVNSDHETVLTYTLDEAKTAGLVAPNSGWTKHPADLCAKTGSTKLARLVYPDVTFGLYSPSELGGDDL